MAKVPKIIDVTDADQVNGNRLVGDGKTDNSQQLTGLLTWLRDKNDGGRAELYFPAGDYLFKSPVDVPRLFGIKFRGCGDPRGGTTFKAASRLVYVGKDEPRAFGFRSCRGLHFEDLAFQYGYPEASGQGHKFTGNLLDFSHGPTREDSAQITIDHCYLGVQTPGTVPETARSLICLHDAIIIHIADSRLVGALRCVVGRPPDASSYSNAVQITSCEFTAWHLAAISNAGESWLVDGCTFEGQRSTQQGSPEDGKGGCRWVYESWYPNAKGRTGGMCTFSNNWVGDVSDQFKGLLNFSKDEEANFWTVRNNMSPGPIIFKGGGTATSIVGNTLVATGESDRRCVFLGDVDKGDANTNGFRIADNRYLTSSNAGAAELNERGAVGPTKGHFGYSIGYSHDGGGTVINGFPQLRTPTIKRVDNKRPTFKLQQGAGSGSVVQGPDDNGDVGGVLTITVGSKPEAGALLQIEWVADFEDEVYGKWPKLVITPLSTAAATVAIFQDFTLGLAGSSDFKTKKSMINWYPLPGGSLPPAGSQLVFMYERVL